MAGRRVAVACVRANRANGCDDCSVPIDLTTLERSIRANELDLDAAAVRWSVTPVSPNYGKAVTTAQFDGAEWLASVIAWESGEVDLDAGRTADGWLVASITSLSQRQVSTSFLLNSSRSSETGMYQATPSRRGFPTADRPCPNAHAAVHPSSRRLRA